MANIKSNKKSRLQDDKRELKNKAIKSRIKTYMKKAKETGSKENVNLAVKYIDQAITSGVFHKNKAARMKSKVMKYETTPKKTKKA